MTNQQRKDEMEKVCVTAIGQGVQNRVAVYPKDVLELLEENKRLQSVLGALHSAESFLQEVATWFPKGTPKRKKVEHMIRYLNGVCDKITDSV